MSWQELVLAIFNSVQVVALAWIASRQQQVKHALNGETAAVHELKEAVVSLTNGQVHGENRK